MKNVLGGKQYRVVVDAPGVSKRPSKPFFFPSGASLTVTLGVIRDHNTIVVY